MKECPRCKCEILNSRKKFCSTSCKYWFNIIKKEKESHLPPVKKRTKDYFLMVIGSEWAKGKGVRQGRRVNGTITGAMAAMVRVTVEQVVAVTHENLTMHFKGIQGYTPEGIKLGDGTRIKKEDIETELGIKL